MRPRYFAALTLSLATFLPGMAQAATPLLFVPVTSCRVIDTRTNGPELGAGGRRDISISNSPCGIPANAAAYSLNVTAAPDGALGYLTIWPTGQPQPVVSTLNSDGRIKANAAIVPAGINGSVTVFATDPTQVIIDINGYFIPDVAGASGLQFFPVTPCRIVDTRNDPHGRIPPQETSQFAIIGNCGIPATAQAFSLNFTAVPAGPVAYITVWPSSQSQPGTSTLNATTGAITANAAIVPAGGNGSVSVYASYATDLVIDVNGYFAPSTTGGLDLFNVTPCRVLDTRSSGSGSPFDGELTVNAGGSSCVPNNSGAQAFVFNATVVPPGPLTYLRLWPDGSPQATVSTLNAIDGAITSNMAIVPSTNGSVDAFGSDPTHLIIDIWGYFAPSSSGGGDGGGGGGGGSGIPTPCTAAPCAFIGGASVGQNLQVLVPITLSPTPTALTHVTVISYSPDVLVSDSASVPGGSSTVVDLLAGSNTVGIYVQALGSSGTAVIGAMADGYPEGEGAVNLFPSAFILQTPNGVGSDFNVGAAGTAPLTVGAAMLNSSGQFVSYQQVRAGAGGVDSQGHPVPLTVGLSVADPSVGSVSPSSLSFAAGDSQMQTIFTAANNANAATTITVNEPSGFTTPSDGSNHAQVSLQPPVLSCTSNIGVGFNLAATGVCTIGGGAAPTDEIVTLTSNNPAALLFAPINFKSPGDAHITLTIPQGLSSTQPFLIIGAASSGTATYTATSALGTVTASITLLQTGFVIAGPTGIGNDFSTTFPGADAAVAVEAAQLDGSGSPLLTLPLAPGVTVSVNVTSSSTSVGQIVGSPAVITGGNSSGLVTFHPAGQGSTQISAAAPPGGYATPGTGSVITAHVGTPGITVSVPGTAVGQNLEEPDTLFLSAPPPSDLTLTLQASGSITLSANGTDAGGATLMLTIPAGQISGLFYIYGQASSGSASITAMASGYNQGTAPVTLGPSAFVVIGPFGTAPSFQTPLASGPQNLTVAPAVLDASHNYVFQEALAGSTGPVTLNLTNQNANAGTVPTSVTVPVAGAGTVTFTPTNSGQQTIISAVEPIGYVTTQNVGVNPGSGLTINVQ